jgi:hypothetical protein
MTKKNDLLAALEGEDEESLEDMVKKLISSEPKHNWGDPSIVEERRKIIVESFKVFEAGIEFSVGQVVKWKERMKNKKTPDYGEPVIVVKILEKPITDTQDTPGSAYYNEELDVLLGSIGSDGNFRVFHFDSHRFELFDA